MNNKLPSGWHQIYFDNEEYLEIIDGDRGKNYPKQKDFFNEGYCVFLNTKNVTKYGFNFNDIKYITKDRDEKLRSGKLKKYDIVMTTRGTIGNIAFYDDKIRLENIRINSGMVIFRVLSNKIFNKYLYIFLSSDIIKKQISNYVSGMAQPQLPISSIHKLYFILPPLDEQKRIADILSLCDDIIENLTKLIEKKELYKKGVMQRVLTGKVRFNGFTDEWEVFKLKEIGNLISGSGFPIKYQGKKDGEIAFIKVSDMNLKENYIFINSANNYIDESELKSLKAKIIPIGSIVFAKIGEAIKLERKKIISMKTCIDNNMAALNPLEHFNKKYIFYLLSNYKLSKHMNFSALPSLNMVEISNIEFKIPTNIEEQKRIAELLSTIDSEIDNLKKQLELRKLQKKGLMQRLLTGEVRV